MRWEIFPLSKDVMLQPKRLLTPAWSKGPYKPTASTKSALTVLGCELGPTTAPRSASRACRVVKCNQYEFDFTDVARSRFAVYALMVLGVGWKHLRRRLGYPCAYEQGLQRVYVSTELFGYAISQHAQDD
jgi:hypothetical protein